MTNDSKGLLPWSKNGIPVQPKGSATHCALFASYNPSKKRDYSRDPQCGLRYNPRAALRTVPFLHPTTLQKLLPWSQNGIPVQPKGSATHCALFASFKSD